VNERAELERRIVDLELRFMQQEKLSEELSQVIADQQRAIDRLVGEVRTLREQVIAGAEPGPKDERPPHY
jgi:SlyX protein